MACSSCTSQFYNYHSYISTPYVAPVVPSLPCVFSLVELQTKLSDIDTVLLTNKELSNYIKKALIQSAINFYDKDCNKFSSNIASM